MVGVNDIVITGLGCVMPIGIGRDAVRDNLLAGNSAIRHLHTLNDERRTAVYGATVEGFNGKEFVTPRKALKVMSREVQMAYAAAHLAWQDADLVNAEVEADRMGVVYGSEIIPGDHQEILGAVRACSQDDQINHEAWGEAFGKQIYPLWMLRNLPNMPACHVGIAVDARGPNNTIAQEEASGVLALSEAAIIIEREQADLMVVGGIGNRVTPTRLAYRVSRLGNLQPFDEQEKEPRRCVPFDVDRHGIVPGEGAGAMILERRSHAVKRGAPILARLAGFASRCGEPEEYMGGSRTAVASAIRGAMESAELDASDLNHVCTQGYSEKRLDIEEANGIEQAVGKQVVSAHSSFMGTAGGACGILEMLASLVAMDSRKTIPILGHRQTDEACPVLVCEQPQETKSPFFLKVSHTPFGQAAAAVFECEN